MLVVGIYTRGIGARGHGLACVCGGRSSWVPGLRVWLAWPEAYPHSPAPDRRQVVAAPGVAPACSEAAAVMESRMRLWPAVAAATAPPVYFYGSRQEPAGRKKSTGLRLPEESSWCFQSS